jgi:hypothetical protein
LRPRTKTAAFFIYIERKIMNKLNIDRIAFIGRTYDEYMKVFDLNEEILGTGKILDCAAGPSSFTVEANSKGLDVTACDVLYDLSPFELFKKGNMDIACVFEKFDAVSDNYTWTFYRDKEHVISCRKMALGRFVKDFTRNQKNGRYEKAGLPCLPYPDNSFSIVLSSHFLFLYSDRFDLDFHTACLKELIRVCSGEVRIYPLTGLDSELCPYMDGVQSFLREASIKSKITEVPFEFQRGSNRMMVIYKENGGSND